MESINEKGSIMISVAMATYNGENYISEQIDSIINQTRKVDEIVIVDDHSTDQTVPILLHLQKDHPEWNIKIHVNTKNVGYKTNFKNAIELTSGDFIFLCDQDDIWHKDKVKKMMNILDSNSRILALTSSFDLIDGNGDPLMIEEKEGRSNHNLLLKKVEADSITEITFEEFVYHNYFQGCSSVIRQELKEDFLNNFSTTLPHDWLIHLLAAKKKGMFFYNHPLFDYRIHEKNTIGMVGEIKPTLKQKWNLMNDLAIREQFAKERVESLSVVEQIDPDFMNQHPEYIKMKAFCEKHCQYLENKQFFHLLWQNFNPIYKQLKTRNARMYDLIFALNKANYN